MLSYPNSQIGLIVQIAFFDADSNELTSYKKGTLFERFTARLVEMSGYRNVQLRAKRSSLEYDIEATSSLHNRKLFGEAKAHEASMSGKEASAFVGKLLPLALSEDGVDGLFISTSPFTPEADDYLGSLRRAGTTVAGINLRTLAGDEIPSFLAERGIGIPEPHLREKVERETGLQAFDAWIIVAERGDFFVVSLGQNVMSTATEFSVFSLAGDWIAISDLEATRLSNQVSDLKELKLLAPQAPQERSGDDAHTLPAVVAGSGWFDYKFPSPPECFIGREAALIEIDKFLTEISGGSTTLRAAQVLSRSGVGKSSLLLKVAASDRGVAAVTVDGRNLRVPADLRLVAAELVELVNESSGSGISIPARQDDIREAFASVGRHLKSQNQLALLQIDQFEALLSRPPVFQAILDLLIACTSLNLPIVWIMARKNDLAATYDEGAAIDLLQMNQLSRPIRLDDFSPPEERALLSRLASELGAPVSQALAEALLTFSAGFPWLLKRVCAHVISMSREGVSQANLSRGGLRAEDLFSEDLAGLEEGDKALLKTLAANMPNTASELSRRLEGEVSVHRLTQNLNDFLGKKLLRLSGDVYDTYNDVFKAYLLTDRIPFQTRFVFRVTPGPAFALLSRIAEEGPMDMGDFITRVGGNATATYNKLRELRLLGFLDPQPGRVALSPEAAAALESDNLGDYLRRALRSNSLVGRLLDLIANEDSVSFDDISSLLQRELPHITASVTTWSSYASVMVNWVRYAGLLDVEGDRVRSKESVSDELLLHRAFTRGTFSAGTFLPSVRPSMVKSLLIYLHDGAKTGAEIRAKFGGRASASLIRDSQALGLVDDQSDRIELSAQGRAIVGNPEELSEKSVAMLCLGKPNISSLLSVAAEGPVSIEKQQAIVSRFGVANWTEGTWKWRLGILNSWVVASGQAKSGRAGIRLTV